MQARDARAAGRLPRGPRRKEIDNELRQPCQSGKIHLFVASADIGMDERSTNACEASRRVPDLSQHEIAFRRRRAAMRRQRAVEGDDASLRQALAQMVVGPPVAEAKLDDWTVHAGKACTDLVENVALCAQSADGAFKAAHCCEFPRIRPRLRAAQGPPVQLDKRTQARALVRRIPGAHSRRDPCPSNALPRSLGQVALDQLLHMLVAGAHTVGAPDGGPGLPGTGWSRAHGDLRVAHFLGLHGLQMLPMLALVFARRGWHEARRVRIVWAMSASYVVLFGLLLWQALRGQSVAAPDSTTFVALGTWALLTAAAIRLSAVRSVHFAAVRSVRL